MMKILCLLVKLVFFALACNIQCTITTEGACLNCWSNLCKRPSGSDDDCTGNSCTDMSLGMLISGVTAEQCCGYASSYVSSSVTNGSILMSNPSPSTEQCTAEQYNEFPTDSADDIETISITNSGRQFILYDTVRFNCSGCVKTISIYTGIAVDTTYVSMLQIWSTNTLNNQTLLNLKREITFELFNSDSVELSGNNNFKNTREINESLCFNASDVFGIQMPADLGETVRSRKSAGNVKTYARDSPSCESLEKVYLLNSDDIVPNPIITVEVTANPELLQPSVSDYLASSSISNGVHSAHFTSTSLHFMISSTSHNSLSPVLSPSSSLVTTSSSAVNSSSSIDHSPISTSTVVNDTSSSPTTNDQSMLVAAVLAAVLIIVIFGIAVASVVAMVIVRRRKSRINGKDKSITTTDTTTGFTLELSTGVSCDVNSSYGEVNHHYMSGGSKGRSQLTDDNEAEYETIEGDEPTVGQNVVYDTVI